MIIVIGVPAAFMYVLNNGNPYYKFVVNQTIPSYIEEQGYSQEDIQSAGYYEPNYIVNKDYLHGHYEVVFKDEPNLIYFYGVKKWSHDVHQFCEKDEVLPGGAIDINQKKTKHTENDCVSYLDNRD